MAGLWIDEVILNLKRKPGDKFLLALICFRAAGANGECRDTDPELAKVTGIHFQTVNAMIAKFKREGLLVVSVDQTKERPRSITPISSLLNPYKEKADSYKEKT